MGLIRVSDDRIGHVTIGEHSFDPKHQKRLDHPAVDSFGQPIPPKYKKPITKPADRDATTNKES